MRYYKTILNTSSEKVLESATIKLRDYGYYNNNVIAAVNGYIYQNLKSGIYFLIYREEENGIYAGIAFDEKKYNFQTAYEEVKELFQSAFGSSCFKQEPTECTMFEYNDILVESRRRDMMNYSSVASWAEMTNVYSHYLTNLENAKSFFSYDEKIVSDRDREIGAIYDKSFIKEFSNIEEHKVGKNKIGNIVHYIISARSIETCRDMALTLSNQLFLSGRIQSRRVGFVTDIRPDIYLSDYIENIIANNVNGAVVIDLSERLGCEPTQYKLAIDFLKGLLKRYRNDCVGTSIRLGAESVMQLEMMPKPLETRAVSNPWPEWPKVLKTDYGQEEAIYKFGSDPRVYQTTITEYIKDKKGNLKAVKLVSLESKKDEKTGRMMMVPVEGSEREVKADIVLIAAGFLGSEGYVRDTFKVECNERTNVMTHKDYETTRDRVFVAGDMHRGQSLVVWAIAEGRGCARAVDESLMGYSNL